MAGTTSTNADSGTTSVDSNTVKKRRARFTCGGKRSLHVEGARKVKGVKVNGRAVTDYQVNGSTVYRKSGWHGRIEVEYE